MLWQLRGGGCSAQILCFCSVSDPTATGGSLGRCIPLAGIGFISLWREFGFMWEKSGKGSRDLRGDPGEPRGVPQFPVPGDAPGSGQSQPGARTGKKIHWEQT